MSHVSRPALVLSSGCDFSVKFIYILSRRGAQAMCEVARMAHDRRVAGWLAGWLAAGLLLAGWLAGLLAVLY